MLPLVALAAGVVPELIKLIAGDKAGAVAGKVADVVQEVTGSGDPVTAQQKLQDPAVVADLRIKLAQIAVEQTKAQNAEADAKRQAELDELRQSIANTQSARETMVGLVNANSSIAWGAPIVSVIVTAGFFIFLVILLFVPLTVNSVTAQIINIVVGALTTGFATVVNFWLGSSQSSKRKDDAINVLQNNQAAQTSRVIDKLASVSTDVATKVLSAQPVVAAPAAQPVPAEVTPVVVATTVNDGDDNFDRCLPITLAQEGGFVDNPNDPGGATNLGITLKTLEAWRGTQVTVQDVRDLTKQEAAEIYRANYWLPSRCNELPLGIDLMVFDFGVNAGPRTSVKLIQRAVGVTDDGSVGPITLKAVNAANPKSLVDALADARLAYYRSLPTFNVFGKGWTSRTDQVKSAALLMVT